MFLVGFFGVCLIEVILRKLFMADDEKRSMCLAVINYVTCGDKATTIALYSTKRNLGSTVDTLRCEATYHREKKALCSCVYLLFLV